MGGMQFWDRVFMNLPMKYELGKNRKCDIPNLNWLGQNFLFFIKKWIPVLLRVHRLLKQSKNDKWPIYTYRRLNLVKVKHLKLLRMKDFS